MLTRTPPRRRVGWFLATPTRSSLQQLTRPPLLYYPPVSSQEGGLVSGHLTLIPTPPLYPRRRAAWCLATLYSHPPPFLYSLISQEGGLVPGHAYSLISARKLNSGAEILKLRNPWVSFEWQGAWSDNSPEVSYNKGVNPIYREIGVALLEIRF